MKNYIANIIIDIELIYPRNEIMWQSRILRENKLANKENGD